MSGLTSSHCPALVEAHSHECTHGETFVKYVIALIGFLFVSTTFAAEPKVCSPIGANFPADTATLTNKDGSMTVGVPDGWFMLQNLNGKWSRTTVAAVTCKCTSGTGCSPGTFGGKVACVMTECTACTKSPGGALSLYPVRNNEADVSFLNKSELGTLPSVDSELLGIPEVQKAIRAFKTSLGVSENAPADFYIAVKIYGRVAAIGLPRTMRLPKTDSDVGAAFVGLAAMEMVIYPNVAAISCKCNVAGSSCPLEGNRVLRVWWCNAPSCSSCTMGGV